MNPAFGGGEVRELKEEDGDEMRNVVPASELTERSDRPLFSLGGRTIPVVATRMSYHAAKAPLARGVFEQYSKGKRSAIADAVKATGGSNGAPHLSPVRPPSVGWLRYRTAVLHRQACMGRLSMSKDPPASMRMCVLCFA